MALCSLNSKCGSSTSNALNSAIQQLVMCLDIFIEPGLDTLEYRPHR